MIVYTSYKHWNYNNYTVPCLIIWVNYIIYDTYEIICLWKKYTATNTVTWCIVYEIKCDEKILDKRSNVL